MPEAYGKFPEFDLSCAIDDEEASEVTIFPGDESADVCTRWITVDIDHAVPLEDTL